MTPYAKNDGGILAALAIPGWYEKRIASKIVIDPETGCWVWQGSLTSGYAQASLPSSVGFTPVRASRVVWLRLRGEIPADHVLDHDGANGCHNKPCVHTDHVEPVTIARNNITGGGFAAENARKIVCSNGHPLVPGNLMPSQVARGQRGCLTCNREYAAQRAAVIREAAITLGLTIRAYVALYGGSRATAEQYVRDLNPATLSSRSQF